MSTVATFRSPTNNLRLVQEAGYRRLDYDTGRHEEVRGTTFEFKDGVLEVREEDGQVTVGDQRVDLETDKVIEFLRNHDNNGVLFFEAGQEPDRPQDDSTATLREVTRLAVHGDVDALADLLVAERSTYSRPEVIAAIETAIEESDGGEVPPKPPTPEHEVERVRREPAVGADVPPVDHPRPAEALAPGGENPDVGQVNPDLLEEGGPGTGGAPVDQAQHEQASGAPDTEGARGTG